MYKVCREQILYGEEALLKIFLIVLLACADWSKIFFQVFLKDGNFCIYISRNETVSVPAAFKVYLYITIGNFWSLARIWYDSDGAARGNFMIEPLYAWAAPRDIPAPAIRAKMAVPTRRLYCIMSVS